MARVAVLIGDQFEDSELVEPLRALSDAGHQAVLLGIHANADLVGLKGRARVRTDGAVRNHHAEEFDMLFIPGGKSPTHLRRDQDVLEFVEAFCTTGRPVAAICHGPQLLIAAGQGRGRRMTAWPSVQEELRAFGAVAEDEPVVEDGAFLTSRGPADLEPFCAALIARANQRPGMEPEVAQPS